MNKKDLEITTGSIADALLQIEQLKAKLSENIALETANKDYTPEARARKTEHWREFYGEKIAELKSGISEELDKIHAHVGEPFQFNPAMAAEVDYLLAMREAGALNNNMLKISAANYTGNENALLFMRTKLKNSGIPTTAFDDLMFSHYDRDINGEMQFHSPAEYFQTLSDVLARGSARSCSIALGDVEKRLGIQSAGLKSLNAKLDEKAALDKPGTQLDGGNTLI